jgi:hypothetical protein
MFSPRLVREVYVKETLAESEFVTCPGIIGGAWTNARLRIWP